MSSDDGIYILKMKDGQAKVTYAQAIDNLFWSFVDCKIHNDLVPTRVIEYFTEEKSMSHDEAIDFAFKMKNRYPMIEHGVQTFTVNKTWDEIMDEAKELAKKEIECIKDNKRWSYKVVDLEKILSMQEGVV